MSCLEGSSVERRLDEEGEEIDDEEVEEEEEEVDDEEDDVEEEEDDEEGEHCETVTVGRRSGRGLTLKTLLKERVLEPGEGSMTINYLGNKFKGDLLPDGRIRSQETSKIFGTPSAWAIYCKKIVNPDKKSGCGWASVRYKGKKLDTYKNNWYRQKRLEYEKEVEEMEEEESGCESEEANPPEQEIIEFDVLGNRNDTNDPATMIELGTFQSMGRMQPFNVTMSSSAMAVIDVHAHLTTSEVVGYLAGQWDVNNHNLIVSHAFPVRCRLGDADKGPSVEQELYSEMARLKLSLVGWYHTHPFAPPLPTLRDVDSQLDYEMKMKGYNDASYTPVLGIIVSPYQKTPIQEKGTPHPNGNATGFWVMPPPENKPLEYGRPMSMQFTVVQDAFIPKEALVHMSEVIKFYKDVPDAIEMTDIFEDKFTYWHKLKSSLKGRVPKDHYAPLVEFLTKVIDKKLPEDDPLPLIPVSPSTASMSGPLLPGLSISATITTTANQVLSSAGLVISPPANLPPSTSLSIMEGGKECVLPSAASLGSFPPLDSLASTKDLESCVSNILKSSMGADLIPIPSSLCSVTTASESPFKEKDHSVTITPTLSSSVITATLPPHPPEKHDEPHLGSSSMGRPRSAERRTPDIPPKSYSPLFQLPLPPLFSLDVNKTAKDSHGLKGTFQPINLHVEEKRLSDCSSAISKSRSPSGKVEKLTVSSVEEPMALDPLSRGSKYDISELANKGKRRDTPEAKAMAGGGYLDLSMMGKDTAEGKAKRPTPPAEESSKKDVKDPSKLGAADVTSWFAQAKLMQEAFSLPPHERDNPFVRATSPATHRDVPGLFSSEFLSSQWNPLLKGAYPTSLAFAGDSKPTYHSDVPLLLKKQQQQHQEEMSSKDILHEAREVSKKLLEEHQQQHPIREFRLPPEYKEPKESSRGDHHKKSREVRDRSRDLRTSPFDDARDFKEPRMLRDPRVGDFVESLKKDSREEKEIKIAHGIRDIQESVRRDFWEVKEQSGFDEMESEGVSRDARDMRTSRDPREVKDSFRDMRERRDSLDQRETRESSEMRDPWDMRDHREAASIHVREDLRERRHPFDLSEGKVSKGAQDPLDTRSSPVNLSDMGSSNDGSSNSGFRSVNPMDMSTFKIKRDLMNPDGRHFIEPTGMKRHLPEPISMESSRNIMDYSDPRLLSASRNSKEGVMNLSSSSSSGGGNKDLYEGKTPLHQQERNEAERGSCVVGFQGSSVMRERPHDNREILPKGLINLIDPKNLMETREYRDIKERIEDASKSDREERTTYPTPPTQRRLFPEDETDEGKEKASSSAPPPVFIPHRPKSTEEPMDYE